MNKTLIGCATALSLLIMPFAQAATICDVKSNLNEARASLVALLDSTDKTQHEALKTAINTASTAVETAIADLLKEKAGDSQLTKLSEVWTEFKTTRETEIIPAIDSGNVAKAKELATTVQAERVKSMATLVTELGGDKCTD